VSWRLAERVRRHGPAKSTMCSVLEALAWHGKDDGTDCRPGLAAIARWARTTERSASRALTQLRRDGWIEMDRHSSGGQGPVGQPTCWTIALDCLTDSSFDARPPRRHTPPVASVRGETHATSVLETHATSALETHATSGVLNQSLNQTRNTARARRGVPDGRPGAAHDNGAGAGRSRPSERTDTVAARSAIKAADAERARACERCQGGWVEQADGRLLRCDCQTGTQA
jgi:hypothetical protein